MTAPVLPRESGGREAFLATIRGALDKATPNQARPVTPLPEGTVPRIEYAIDTTDLVATFTRALTALGGVVRDPAEQTFLDDVLNAARRGPDMTVRVVLTDEPECVAIKNALEERDDVEILPYDNPATVATADLGITGARGAVALTGSIVVDAHRADGRTVSLLPPVHLALVKAENIVATPGDHWRSLHHPMPSNLVQITGPSRSADIELIITLGVHGPRALWVGVMT